MAPGIDRSAGPKRILTLLPYLKDLRIGNSNNIPAPTFQETSTTIVDQFQRRLNFHAKLPVAAVKVETPSPNVDFLGCLGGIGGFADR